MRYGCGVAWRLERCAVAAHSQWRCPRGAALASRTTPRPSLLSPLLLPRPAAQRPSGGRGRSAPPCPCGLAESSGKLAQYAHPVRLFWPKSRCYDYLYQEAEALLKNFPVQATISFYEDTDSEEDEGELEQDARAESHC
ncbi:protein ripply2 isoform X1 [Phasianus colchicus]|uniref:protein ripply2 isoform X1 n=1 Tax=Phasianus colchicus TaxID=9054 RepID=UPI00129E9C65|nr:protein ripply2 isoform X1 [Phasianus colchicus]